jgi:hypothetical protein
LIVRPEECDRKKIDVGAYIVLDVTHKTGVLEYGLGDSDEALHILDSSSISFDLESPRCRFRSNEGEVLLTVDEILGMFSSRKGVYGFVSGSFELDSNGLEGGRVCNITGIRVLSDVVRDERE